MIKTVVLLGGGIQEVAAVKQLQHDGWKVCVVDQNPHCACSEYANCLIISDCNNVERITQEIVAAQSKIGNPKAVFTLTELTTSASIIASALNLKAPSIKSVAISQSKAISKKLWLKKNIPTPAGVIYNKKNNLHTLKKKIKLPCVVKPSIGYGGRGVTIVKKSKSLGKAISAALESSSDGTCIIEDYVEGTLHDGNAFFLTRRRFYPLSISDRFYINKNNLSGKTIGSLPSKLERERQEKFFLVFKKACLALGIDYGPVKMDAIWDGKKFYVLEVAARLHGPRGTLHMIPNAYGKSLLVDVINALSNDQKPNWYFLKPKRVSIYEDVFLNPQSTLLPPNNKGVGSESEIAYLQLLSEKINNGRKNKDYKIHTCIFCYGKDLDSCMAKKGEFKRQLFRTHF